LVFFKNVTEKAADDSANDQSGARFKQARAKLLGGPLPEI
jgi:hypothetical protein